MQMFSSFEANDAKFTQKFMTDLRQKTHEKLGWELLYRKEAVIVFSQLKNLFHEAYQQHEILIQTS